MNVLVKNACFWFVAGSVDLKNYEHGRREKEDETNHLSSDSTATLLGDDLYSWGWDMKDKKVYHAGKALLSYPPMASGKSIHLEWIERYPSGTFCPD